MARFIKVPLTRLIVVKGLRRSGKTSLILSTLNFIKYTVCIH